MARYRERDLSSSQTGVLTIPRLPSYRRVTMARGGWETCSDTVGSRETDNFFHVRRCITTPHQFSFTARPGSYDFDGEAFIHRYGTGEAFEQPLSDTVNNLAVEGIAKANPSKPHISIPTFLGEFKDIPRTIKSIGDNHVANFKKDAVKSASEANLTLQFGLLPLFSDVGKLFDFTHSTQRRYRELSNLASNGGTSRNRTVDAHESTTYENRLPMWTNYEKVYANKTRIVSSRTWVSTRWIPNETTLQKFSKNASAKEASNYSKRINAGLTSSGALQTAWELVPWSFLLDYFGNMGDFLKATDNSVASRVSACLMHSTTTSLIFEEVSSTSGVTYIPGTLLSTVKRRWPISIIHPSATSPFLNKKQLGILTSLSILNK